jgi:hypothetical protein
MNVLGVPNYTVNKSPLRSCLVLYAKSLGRVGIGRLGDLLGGLQEVVWAAN